MMLERAKSVLVLVDYQSRLMPSIHGGEAAVAEAVFLARAARALGVPVVGTEQNPAGLGPNVDEVRALCEPTLAKTHFDAVADGLTHTLQAAQRARGGELGHELGQVVIAGCEAHVCLMQTALGLLASGLRVMVVADACGSRRPADKELAMQRLARADATLVGAEMVVFEWLRTCQAPEFRAVLQLVKDRPVR